MGIITEKELSFDNERRIYLDSADVDSHVQAVLKVLTKHNLTFEECFSVIKGVYLRINGCRPTVQ
jgi:hypothetical protein